MSHSTWGRTRLEHCWLLVLAVKNSQIRSSAACRPLLRCRALHQGCIPVTFWVNSDLPYEKHGLGVDYSAFTVNIAPSQMGYVNSVLLSILNDPPRLLAMQQALAKVSAIQRP